jgi:hypothetical protein
MTPDQIEAANAFHAHEMATGGDADWERWTAKVERLSGVTNLDGDGQEDGYSLDECYDWYLAGWSAERAADKLRPLAPGRT